MDEREKNLPKWAQELIKDLRNRVEFVRETSVKELAESRPKIALLERKVAALEELITCAAKGGHRTSQEIINVFEIYSLTATKED